MIIRSTFVLIAFALAGLSAHAWAGRDGYLLLDSRIIESTENAKLTVGAVRKDKILLYYGANNGRFMGWRDGFFCLARLRPDGFAGYEQIEGGSNKTATITTRPVLAVADSLRLSADVATSGYVKVTLFDKEKKELTESELIAKTVTDAEVQWPEGFSFRSLKGSEIRLRFELRDARLYSFSFTRTSHPLNRDKRTEF